MTWSRELIGFTILGGLFTTVVSWFTRWFTREWWKYLAGFAIGWVIVDVISWLYSK